VETKVGFGSRAGGLVRDIAALSGCERPQYRWAFLEPQPFGSPLDFTGGLSTLLTER